jgi:hypothetical protein
MAYVILVIIEDLNVPPIDEHNAEHAVAPQHDIIAVTGASGKDTIAPIYVSLFAFTNDVYNLNLIVNYIVKQFVIHPIQVCRRMLV